MEKELSNRSSRIASNLVLLLMPRTFSDAIDIVLEWSERHGELSSDENLGMLKQSSVQFGPRTSSSN